MSKTKLEVSRKPKDLIASKIFQRPFLHIFTPVAIFTLPSDVELTFVGGKAEADIDTLSNMFRLIFGVMNCNELAHRPTFVLVVFLVCLNVGIPVIAKPVQSLMEYFIMAVDCMAMVGVKSKSGWPTLVRGLQQMTPIGHKIRCYAYCFMKKAGIIEDEMAFRWNDYVFTEFVSVLIKDNTTRGNFVINCYFRCKHVVPAVFGTSRCNNALLFLVCLRALGVSFLLTDDRANAEQNKFVTQAADQEEMSRAEAFWNAFDGAQKHMGVLKDDCPLSPGSNKTLAISISTPGSYLFNAKEYDAKQHFLTEPMRYLCIVRIASHWKHWAIYMFKPLLAAMMLRLNYTGDISGWRNQCRSHSNIYSRTLAVCQTLSLFPVVVGVALFIAYLKITSADQVFPTLIEQPVLLLIPDFTFCSIYTNIDPVDVVGLFGTSITFITRNCLRNITMKFVDKIGKTWDILRVSKYLLSISSEWRRKVEARYALYSCRSLQKNMTTKYGCKNAFNFFYCLYNHGMSFMLTEKEILNYRAVYEARHPYPDDDDEYYEEEPESGDEDEEGAGVRDGREGNTTDSKRVVGYGEPQVDVETSKGVVVGETTSSMLLTENGGNHSHHGSTSELGPNPPITLKNMKLNKKFENRTSGISSEQLRQFEGSGDGLDPYSRLSEQANYSTVSAFISSPQDRVTSHYRASTKATVSTRPPSPRVSKLIGHSVPLRSTLKKAVPRNRIRLNSITKSTSNLTLDTTSHDKLVTVTRGDQTKKLTPSSTVALTASNAPISGANLNTSSTSKVNSNASYAYSNFTENQDEGRLDTTVAVLERIDFHNLNITADNSTAYLNSTGRIRGNSTTVGVD